MKIDRSSLISELSKFARGGNGVVIGPPGVGKSYAIAELREKLKQSHIPHLILPVERIGAATAAELKPVLRRDGDFIQLLRAAVSASTSPAILIFDGFDAARGEIERAGVFRLILRAVNELRGCWNIIVSVRTFDAKKSQRLLDLFPEDQDATSTGKPSCRQFSIPCLREDELEQAFSQVSGLRELHSSGTRDFRALLAVPFNLWLIERVLTAGAPPSEFSQITSEVQLLEMYWRYRVRQAPQAEDREFILAKATGAMVGDHTLTVRRDKIYTPEVRAAWEGLLSDEILTEVTEPQAHVAFTHNILFDFAASVHLLDPDPGKLALYVAAEPARPLFLRPSLVYHFTRLWHFQRQIFWRNFWSIMRQEAIHLRQIVRLVLPTVIVNESTTLQELSPLLEQLEKKETRAFEAVAFLLQAVRVLRPCKRELWAEFIKATGLHLDQRFAWDAGIIANWVIEPNEQVSGQSAANCGDFGRKLLTWAWSSRSDASRKQWFERLAGFIAIPLVAKTYATNPEETRAQLEQVLRVVGEPDFPIDCIYRLTNEVGHIIPVDPDFVAAIYERVFGYEEASNEQTNMGGHVMPLLSNRRQDYGMCRYCLMKEFPRFLNSKPSSALRAGIRAIQAFAIQGHVLRYLKEGATLSNLTREFRFLGANARYVQDGSAIWDESSYPDQEMQIVDQVFSWVGTSIKQQRTDDIDNFLSLFAAEGKLAFMWSRLLTSGAEHPAILGPRLWELARAKPILEGNDTLYSVGAFLERAVEFLSPEQRREIEQAILGLAEGVTGEKVEFLQHRRNRLIARLAPEALITKDAADLRHSLESESALPPNQPLFSVSSSWEPYTEDRFLRDQGAKLDSAANQSIQALYKPLREWSEKNKPEAEIDLLLPNVDVLRDALSKEGAADKAVQRAAWTHLASFASDAILRTQKSDTERFRKLRSIILEAALHSDPEPNPEYDARWSSASWSPAPRNEAAQALPWLTHFGEDKDALAAIQTLAKDPVPSVRFLLACELWRAVEKSPEVAWLIFDDMAKNEKNDVVLDGITVSLWQLIRLSKTNALALIRKLIERLVEESDEEEKPRSHLICMVVDYAIWDDNDWAKQTLDRWRLDPVKFPASIARAGRRLVEYIKPEHLGVRLERARGLLLACLDAAAQGLTKLQSKDSNKSQEELQKKWKLLYGLFDEAVMRIYFAADIDPNFRERKERPLDDHERRKYFQAALPILENVLGFGKQPETGMLLAPTAHHFMEILNGMLRYEPRLVLRLAAEVVACSKRFNFNLDSLALGEVVKLVESILADYREEIQDDASINNLLGLLDAFVEAGWPEALQLVWRLDEIYR